MTAPTSAPGISTAEAAQRLGLSPRRLTTPRHDAVLQPTIDERGQRVYAASLVDQYAAARRLLMTPADAAAALGVSVWTLRHLDAELLPIRQGTGRGHRRRYRREIVEHVLGERAARAAVTAAKETP